jgi:predicted transposase YbfD/YdcC
MPVKDKELKKAIRLGIKTLILQEVRLSRLERVFTPYVMTDEMSHSIQETKRMIIKLTRSMDHKKRTVLLKRMVCQAVDEEIDRAIELRKTKCIRCLHGRFYDEAGTAYVNLPVKTRAVAIGCDKLRPNLRKSCRRFVQMSMATSLDQYLNEMTLLHEFRELIDRIEEIWKDYLMQ